MKARLPKNVNSTQPNNMGDMIKQAQKMQSDIEKVQENLSDKEFSVSVGGGMLEATVTGKKELKSIKLKKEVVNPEDIEMLEDLIISGVNQAMKKAEETIDEEMGKVTGGMNIPGLI
ncbi:MAG: YbaB/EbfC family nucleoid-associated protein [Oscillospiraceae bacterium]|nr:YbaB/EbfC family nucleoid-associated protein [Oscillospiraceae bacterium]